MAQKKPQMDVDVSQRDLAALTSPDSLTGFLSRLGYDTSKRGTLKPEAIGLSDPDQVFRHMELLSEDKEGFLRVIFAQVRSITAKARNDLVRTLGRFSQDHLIILTSDFQVLEFVLIDKVKRRQHGPATVAAYKPVPKVYSVQRKAPGRLDLRILRRLTFTQSDGLDQFDKLRSVFEAAVYTGEYYQNRALFADHYLNTRLQESPAWAESPNAAFAAVRDICTDARERLSGKDEATARNELIEPLFRALGFKYAKGKDAKDGGPTPDYLLKGADCEPLTVALVYQWDRWLDGPDPSDQQTPDENPGASVVSVLERGDAEWVIVTNGKHWRLYSRQAHSRSTNFYEVDLAEALIASADTDPGEAFRYWWLFFRPEAFAPVEVEGRCWLDGVAAGSREYAKQVEQRLKKRVFEHIVPHLAIGFLTDREKRLGLTEAPSDAELEEIREGSLTLLYRLLFLLYAESRDLLPIRESPYFEKSLRKLQREIAGAAGPAEDAVDEKLAKAYKADRTDLYDRLTELCAAMDTGDPALNVPTYNGGLFLVKPDKADESREARIARFLAEHKVPDLYLAQAIDHLGRDPDEKTCGMVFIDYKSLGVRQLGSIYEGLLEFRLKVASEDLTTVKQKGREKVIPLSQSKRKRSEIAVRKGEVYLANDKGERKASGSYYTPDHIVEYIVDNAVSPVLAEKLEALRPALRDAEKTYQRHLANQRNNPGLGGDADPREFAAEKTYAAHKELVEQLFDCKILDPAMGSGHFLVEAVDYITDKLLDFLNRFPHNPVAIALEHTRRSILESLSDQGVAVDPDKLTDVHLLKRHVLKRCIYGVDLNPMAVELAKVSLWLDAFTLGAPLSFLDHHLRCGNSLIGATFDDLEQSTAGQLFAIDYEPMYRAINNVLTVARLADATAAEVHHSADAYAAARRELSGYQIILDILVARHFGTDAAMTLLQHGDQLDLRSAEGLMKGMKGIDRKMIEQVEDLAAERSFFHWELEFPEVFFGPREGTQRQIEHKPADQAGFDAVVGNPPYVRQETIKADKAYFKFAFQVVYEATCDLYVYFMQREIDLLRAGGLMSMIVANKWLRAGYGKKLRDVLLRCAKPESIVDFGHSPIFPDADTFPCVPVFSRRTEAVVSGESPPPNGEVFLACSYPREDYVTDVPIAPYILTRQREVPIALLDTNGWSLEDPRIQALLRRLGQTTISLARYVQSPLVYGIKTGANEAFCLDEATRSALVRIDSKSEELIHPMLRGRDIDRWAVRTSGMYMIITRRGVDIDRYPAVRKHLAKFRQNLELRPADWDSTSAGNWPGRAPGDYAWYELQASPSGGAMAAFTGPKAVYQEMGWFNRFAFDTSGAVPNNTAYVIADSRPSIRGILNSPLAWWYMTRTAQHGKDEVLRLIGTYMDKFPMPPEVDEDAFTKPVDDLTELMRGRIEWESEAITEVADLTDRAEIDARVLTWLKRPDSDFLRMVQRLTRRELSRAQTASLSRFRHKARDELGYFLSKQLKLEKQLAVLVEDAYALTLEERQLLRDTRPIRDPIDVLEAKLAGFDFGEPSAEASVDD